MRTNRHVGLDFTTVLENAVKHCSTLDQGAYRISAMKMARAGSHGGKKARLRDRPTHADALAVKKFSWE